MTAEFIFLLPICSPQFSLLEYVIFSW